MLVGSVREIETSLGHTALNHIVYACVGFPVGRTNPNVGDVAKLLDNLIDVLLPVLFDITHKKLVTTQTEQNVIGVIFIDIFLYGSASAIDLGSRAVPHNGIERVSVLLGIGRHAWEQALHH